MISVTNKVEMSIYKTKKFEVLLYSMKVQVDLTQLIGSHPEVDANAAFVSN